MFVRNGLHKLVARARYEVKQTIVLTYTFNLNLNTTK